MEVVPREVFDINASKRMNFVSNSILGKTPKFVDLRLSPANTADKLNPVFYPATRYEGLTDIYNWLASRQSIAEFAEGRVSEAKSYSNYTKNSEFETMNVFERENISLTRPISLTHSCFDSTNFYDSTNFGKYFIDSINFGKYFIDSTN